MRITVLNDNRIEDKELKCEHGLSLIIETNDSKILFDAGQSDIFLQNAYKLEESLTDIDAIVLSHGDYDHGNGLKYLNIDTRVNLYAHPDIFNYRVSKRTGNYGGLNQTKEEFLEKYNLICSKECVKIGEDVYFLGEIKKYNTFEEGNLPMLDQDNNEYKHHDDSGIVIKTSKGLVVISGCAHSGICNTVEYAKEVINEDRVFAVIGGFHLKEDNERLRKTIEYFKENNVKKVLLAHCVSDDVCSVFLKELPSETTILKTGNVLFYK